MKIHRTTWIALPILALIVGGAGTGWWGYQQHVQRQALAVHVVNTYNAALHGLTGDMEQIHRSLGEALVTNDRSLYSQRMQNVARLAYTAKADVSRLPANSLPNGGLQAFASNLGRFADQQAVSKQPLGSSHQQLTAYWTQSGKVVSALHGLTTQVSDTHNAFMSNVQNLTPGRGAHAPAMTKGLQQLDAAVSGVGASTPKGASHARSASLSGTKRQRIVSAFTAFVGVPNTGTWQVQFTSGADGSARLLVSNTTGNVPIYGTVNPANEQVMSFHLDRPIGAHEAIDLVQACKLAQQWLQVRGFASVTSTETSQFDHTAYCVFAPSTHGIPVIDEPIVVHVGLDHGTVLGYQGTAYDQVSLRGVLPRRFSSAALRAKLNPAFHVQETREVVALDNQHQPQPAVAFYGTNHGETYRVVVNAHSGVEMKVTQLTDHA